MTTTEVQQRKLIAPQAATVLSDGQDKATKGSFKDRICSDTPSTATQANNVLIAGHCSSSYVVSLYKEIRRRLPFLDFDVVGFVRVGDHVSFGEEGVFRQFHESPASELNWRSISGLIRACFSPHLWRRLWWRLVTRNWKFRQVAHDISNSIRVANFRAHQQPRGGYDLYHFHFPDAEHLLYLEAVPDNAKVVCSFWGSDLLRVHGCYEYAYQSQALARAEIITVETVELREILLSKFGRFLSKKVRCALFPLNEKIYSSIDRVIEDPLKVHRMRSEFDIHDDQLLVAIGHNGNPANDHLRIIEALGRLTREEKEKVVCVFPMTYFAQSQYISAVEAAAHAVELNYRVIRRYFDWSDLAAFRVATDVLVHTPISDGFNATVLESLYAGIEVIAGAWLPYSPFHRCGLPLDIVDDVTEVAERVRNKLQRGKTSNGDAAAVRQRIRSSFSADAIVQPWVQIYQDLLTGPATS